MNAISVINLTPHAISVQHADGIRTTYPADGTVARVSVQAEVVDTVLGVPVVVNSYGNVEGLRPANTYPAGTVILVSAMVLGRLDSSYAGLVFAPDTGATAVRNEAGQVVAVTRLVGVGE